MFGFCPYARKPRTHNFKTTRKPFISGKYRQNQIHHAFSKKNFKSFFSNLINSFRLDIEHPTIDRNMKQTFYFHLTYNNHFSTQQCDSDAKKFDFLKNLNKLTVKPDKIQVQSEQSGPLKAGEKARFHCGASGHTSKPLISWWKSELREDRLAALNESVRAQLFTKIADNEVLEFQAMPDDHGKVLKCKVNMPTLDTFELSEHVSIQVLCKWEFDLHAVGDWIGQVDY